MLGDSAAAVGDIRRWFGTAGLLAAGDIAVLGGSLAAGLGNATSDADIYILRESVAPALDGHQFFPGGRRVDMHDLSYASFEEAVAGLADEAAAAGSPAGELHTLVYRVLNGITLSERHVGDGLRGRGNEALRRSLVRASTARLAGLWDQLRISALLGDADRRAIAARDLAEEALYGALADRGLTYPNRKWSAEKLGQLADPRPVSDEIARLAQALVPGPDGTCDAGPVRAALGRLGLRPALASGPLYPRRPRRLSLLAVGSRWYAVLGPGVFQVSGGTRRLLGLCEGDRSVGDILAALHRDFGTSRSRIDEDATHALQDCYGCGLVEFTSRAAPSALEPPTVEAPVVEAPVFEPSVDYVGPAAEFLVSCLRAWSSWLDFLAHRDDLRGALGAGQRGAAIAAGRGLCLDMLGGVAADRYPALPDPDGVEVARRYFGPESGEYRLVAAALGRAVTDHVTDAELRRVADVCAAEFQRRRMPLAGGLLDADAHAELFRYLGQLLAMAAAAGVTLPVSDLMLEKARTYGAGTPPPGPARG